MKDLIDALPVAESVEYLLDTCFLIDIMKKGKIKQLEWFCAINKTGMTSFNLEEVVHVHHKLKGDASHQLRTFFKQKLISNVKVPVSPGNRIGEVEYVNESYDWVLKIIPDPSDAVLIATALRINASVLTKDRHHIYTAVAENKGIKVLKELP
ncbi:MAG: PIN domain-containing protein [Nanoarchaeota archaeon]|nr:PIN domain-containing protein [Nanoarchaeota archaeon]